MSCPFASSCRVHQALTDQAHLEHLAWAFCWGEFRDCNHYKCAVASQRSDLRSSRYAEDSAVAQKERILSRLRASLLDVPMNTR
jgi:hypothetical protein